MVDSLGVVVGLPLLLLLLLLRSPTRTTTTMASAAAASASATATAAAKTLHAHKRINGSVIAKALLRKTGEGVGRLVEEGWPRPTLVSVTFGTGNEAIARYVRNQRRAAESCGVAFEEKVLDPGISRADMANVVHRANIDPRVTGVIFQRPVPPHLSVREIQEAVHPLKDVEGMHPSSIGHVVYGEAGLAPCTARAAVLCLKSTSLGRGRATKPKEGHEVVVVGHSEIVGKPVSFMLMNEGASVTTCHADTRDLRAHTRMADAVIVAVGKPNLIRGADLKPGAALIDIGINADPRGGDGIVGDADFDSCVEVAGWITPVPGGVGPVTTAVLMENTLIAAKRQQAGYRATYGSFSARPLVV